MQKLGLLPFCLLLIATFSGASSHSLNCTNHLEAVEGAAMEVLCQSEVEIDSCAFNFPGFKKIKVYAGVKNQNYEFVGNYEKGECGIRFSAMKRELEGQVTVDVTFPDEDAPAEAKINVTMLYPPANCSINSNGHNFEFKEGDEMTFNCSCSKSNPLPNISLRLGDDKPFIASNQASIKASKTAEISDFNKRVVCEVHHPHLIEHQGGFINISRALTILHKPRIINSTQIDADVGRNKEVKVTVSAYPKPQNYNWMKKNGNLVLKNCWLKQDEHLRCIWEVGVNVTEITQDDSYQGFSLTIENSEGLYTSKAIAQKGPSMNMLMILCVIFIIVSIIALCLCIFRLLRKQLPSLV